MSSPLINIVLIDDHKLVLDGFATMLKKSKIVHIVATFQNPLLAIQYIETHHSEIDVIVTDISMQEMSGIELCKKLKLINLDTKVLFLSMYDSIAIVREAILAEADGYLLKSADLSELIVAIQKIHNNGTYFTARIASFFNTLSHEKDHSQVEETEPLTEREKEILQLIVNDNTSEEIATKLFISVKTVGHHRQHLLSKTGCRSSVGLVKYALKKGLFTP
jgi:DNA-binding NarL/FixJ family response regulator